MWIRYRKFKVVAVPVLAAFALWLLQTLNNPQPNVFRMTVGTGLALFLGAAYVVEERIWAKRGGRPCIQCGHIIAKRPFWSNDCPNCGKPFG